MRALAITGMVTAALMPSIMSGSLMRATPPCTRMSAGTRSRAMTAEAPASSAILACSGVTTSMMTPPLSISASPRLTRKVPVARGAVGVGWSAMAAILLGWNAGALGADHVFGAGCVALRRFWRRTTKSRRPGGAVRRRADDVRHCPSGASRRRRRRKSRVRDRVGLGADRDLRRPAGLGQLDPRPPRRQLHRGPGGVLVHRWLLRVGPIPRPLDDLAVGEDPGFALAHRDRLLGLAHAGDAHVGDELDDHVRRCDLDTVVVD